MALALLLIGLVGNIVGGMGLLWGFFALFLGATVLLSPNRTNVGGGVLVGGIVSVVVFGMAANGHQATQTGQTTATDTQGPVGGWATDAASRFETERGRIDARLTRLASLTEADRWTEALRAGEEIQRDLGPLFRSSIAQTPDVSAVRARLDDLLATARKMENLARRQKARQCTATGIGREEAFAEQVCRVAPDYGLHPEEVHAFGAGGVDVFIPRAEGRKLRADRTALTRAARSLTRFAQANHGGVTAVEVTIVSGDARLAQGSKVGTSDTRITIY